MKKNPKKNPDSIELFALTASYDKMVGESFRGDTGRTGAFIEKFKKMQCDVTSGIACDAA